MIQDRVQRVRPRAHDELRREEVVGLRLVQPRSAVVGLLSLGYDGLKAPTVRLAGAVGRHGGIKLGQVRRKDRRAPWAAWKGPSVCDFGSRKPVPEKGRDPLNEGHATS